MHMYMHMYINTLFEPRPPIKHLLPLFKGGKTPQKQHLP